MKNFILVILFTTFLFYLGYSQDPDKTVVLIVSGQGNTVDDARTKALRSAIEQAFGAFISSKTEILNDSLLKDEIVSVANGNIQKYEIIDEALLPNNNYTTTLKATVSIGRLTTFCQSKGINSEFNGGLFAMNIAMQELNEKNEIQGVDNLYQVFTDLLPKCLDYKIIPLDPVFENEKWRVQLNINVNLNKNYNALSNQVFQFIRSISMNEAEVNSYKSLKKPLYQLKIHRDKSFEGLSQSQLVIDTFYVRNIKTYNTILSFPYTVLKFIISNLKYNNSIETHDLLTFLNKYYNTKNNYLFKLESKLKFYKYLDFYSGYKKEFIRDHSATIFVHKSIINGRLLVGDRNNTIIGTNRFRNDGLLYTNLVGNSDTINSNWYKNDLISKILVPGEPIFNLHGHSNKEFLNIKFSEYFTIEELKKITEYKVEPIK
jgi:hypothetical protein